jgi:glycosyltransferase involved in cell wall biosynthesis
VSEPIPVAFYAPLKHPHHPLPSGDRTMARLLLKALEAAGLEPSVASTLRTFDGIGDEVVQERLRRQCLREADRLIAAYRASAAGRRPRLWFTYHVYYKAPDWIGPVVAEALAIPYVIAEGSRASKRADGPWARGHRGAEAALDRARAVFVMTGADRPALENARPSRQSLVPLDPFTDVANGCSKVRTARKHASVRLLTVAMMRRGDKLASYGILVEALGRIGGDWSLDVVGDGDARAEVERLFSPFGARVRLHGQIADRACLTALYEQADLFLWPGVNEAYGMVFLEAQAFGCPVVAGNYGGIASVVRHGSTGILTPPGDAAAFATAVEALVGDAERRSALGLAASRFVRDERSLPQATETLKRALGGLIAEEPR